MHEHVLAELEYRCVRSLSVVPPRVKRHKCSVRVDWQACWTGLASREDAGEQKRRHDAGIWEYTWRSFWCR